MKQEQAYSLVKEHGSPLFVYDIAYVQRQANILKTMPLDRYTVRYAMKANSHTAIIAAVHEAGLSFDASSSYEAEYLVEQGVPHDAISLNSQQSPHNWDLIKKGVRFKATSLHQLDQYIKHFPGKDIGVRINPGLGSGFINRLSVGGVSASFGIWHEYIANVIDKAQAANSKVTTLATHIGSGTRPEDWEKTVDIDFELLEQLPDVTTLNLGGGFKIAYESVDIDAQMYEIGVMIQRKRAAFEQRTGRTIHIEIEPGKFLVASAGTLLSQVDDIVDTGNEGYSFLRLNTGMDDFARPTMYGAYHKLEVLPVKDEERAPKNYVVVGHCCESSDILTTVKGSPEELEPRTLVEARIGDIVAISDVGGYCASMRFTGYNSFPGAREVVL